MTWIRMDAAMKNDASVHAIAAECARGDVPKVIGHLQCVFAELPQHARDGDLSRVPASLLEQWAMWTGKRGAFDAAVRAHLCTADGVLRSWEKHNGAALRANDANAERQARHRAKANAARRADATRDAPPTPAPRNAPRNATRNALRNGVTERNELQPPSPADAGEVPPSSVGRSPDGPIPLAAAVPPVAALPWPDPATAAAADRVLARGAEPVGFAARCAGWAETGAYADGGRPVGWPAVCAAVRDYADAAATSWSPRHFDGFVRRAAKAPAPTPVTAARSTPTPDGPRARCAALLAAEGWGAATDAWAAALGTDAVHARRVVAAVRPSAEHAPVTVAVELLVSERDRVAVGAA